MMYDNDHLEDYDSAQGDVENGSRVATYNRSVGVSNTIYDESIRRGMMNARVSGNNNDSTVMSPNRYMDHILNNGGGGDDFSVNTRQMQEMIDDTVTFDGSTIASTKDRPSSNPNRFGGYQQQPHHAIVELPPQYRNYGNGPRQQHSNHSDTVKQTPSSYGTTVTKKSSSSGSHDKDEKSRRSGLCCGFGKCCVVLILLVVLALTAAVVAWLLLIYFPNNANKNDAVNNGNQSPPTPSPSLLCCTEDYSKDLVGRRICHSSQLGDCCIVCAAQEEDNPETDEPKPKPEPKPETEDENPVIVTTVEPTAAAPTAAPSQPSRTPEPTDAEETPSPTTAPTTSPTTEAPSTMAPTFPSLTTAPTSPLVEDDDSLGDDGALNNDTATKTAPTISAVPCCTDGQQWADYIGRVRCNDEGSDCCKVCSLRS